MIVHWDESLERKEFVHMWSDVNKGTWCVSSTFSPFYGVRGVTQIKYTMSDSFLVFYYFDILSMIKRKNPFGFYCVILILDLSRLISLITILISKVCRVWFLKWHFWFPKFIAFDFSNNTFDFQNLSRLISQMTREFDFQNFSIFITKWTLMFSKFVEYALWNAFLIANLFPTDILSRCLISKIRSFGFPNGVSDF